MIVFLLKFSSGSADPVNNRTGISSTSIISVIVVTFVLLDVTLKTAPYNMIFHAIVFLVIFLQDLRTQ